MRRWTGLVQLSFFHPLFCHAKQTINKTTLSPLLAGRQYCSLQCIQCFAFHRNWYFDKKKTYFPACSLWMKRFLRSWGEQSHRCCCSSRRSGLEQACSSDCGVAQWMRNESWAAVGSCSHRFRPVSSCWSLLLWLTAPHLFTTRLLLGGGSAELAEARSACRTSSS